MGSGGRHLKGRGGRAFAVDLETRSSFAHRLDRPRGGTPLRFERCDPLREEHEEISTSNEPGPAARVRLSRLGEHARLVRFGRSVHFAVERQRIGYRLLDADHAHLVELRFLGPVMAFWLELQGLPALHASAVVAGGRAVAFLSGNGGGKTSLAASAIQAGYPLLTDDVLAVEPPAEPPDRPFLARPSYPQMRLWPRDAERFLGSAEGLERVHPRYAKLRVPVGEGGFGTFHHESAPLGAIYLVERPGTGTGAAGGPGEPGEPGGRGEPAEPPSRPIIEPLAPHRALIELVRHTFTPRLVEAAGLQPRRLEVLARLVERVPVRRLVVPSGPRGREAALDAALAGVVRASEI